jgi:lipopolysaccharide transport system ATP-binding protein
MSDFLDLVSNSGLMDEWICVSDEGFKLKAEKRLSQTVNQTKLLVMASHSK